MVLLQDMAAMMVIHPDISRADHPLFESLGVFATQEFSDFKAEMEKALSTEVCPLDASIEKVLPGVHQWHRINNQEMVQLKSSMRNLSSELSNKLSEGFQEMTNCLASISNDIKSELDNSSINIGRQLLLEATMVSSSSPTGGIPTRALDSP